MVSVHVVMYWPLEGGNSVVVFSVVCFDVSFDVFYTS